VAVDPGERREVILAEGPHRATIEKAGGAAETVDFAIEAAYFSRFADSPAYVLNPSGAAVLLFAEMARRATAKGYQWADLSVTGEDNLDTFPLAHRMGAKIYKRYRFFRRTVEAK
jgi:hypothetical protein